jgi:phosphonate transport system substrate-binding protein
MSNGPNTLRLTSLVSTIADPFCIALADYLTGHLQLPVTFVAGTATGSREALLDTQAVDLVWLCGLLYLHKIEAGQRLTPAVAPCMVGETPEEQPVYYADIIVNAGSAYQTFADLRGAVWAYNEEASFSGYQIVRAHLGQQKEFRPYFGRTVKSGAHLQSIALVQRGVVDCAAIDSTVLQMARARDRPMIDGIRTVARLGPYPMPLWAFTERGDPAARQPIVAALCHMHQDDVGRHLLAQWQIAQLMAVNPQAYEPLRIARALAQQLAW